MINPIINLIVVVTLNHLIFIIKRNHIQLEVYQGKIKTLKKSQLLKLKYFQN